MMIWTSNQGWFSFVLTHIIRQQAPTLLVNMNPSYTLMIVMNALVFSVYPIIARCHEINITLLNWEDCLLFSGLF